MFLRLGTDGPYYVTNGKILLRVFCLFCRADILLLNLISERVWVFGLSNRCRVICVWIVWCFLQKCSFWRWALRSLKASPLIKPLLTPAWRVAGGEMCILESFCWFEVRSHLEKRFLNLIRPCIRMYPGKLFLYLKFQPWILWSDDPRTIAIC